MYMSEKHQSPSPAPPAPPAIDYQGRHDMIIEVSNTHLPPHHNHHLSTADNSTPTASAAAACGGGEQNSNNSSNPSSAELKAPKKRAETWVKEETRALINLRREIDSLFNTSKSNKHLWEQISMKMRERGFDRSPTMCTDKWRNLLKEFKKAAKRDQDRNGLAKMMCFKEIEEIMKDRGKENNNNHNGASNYKRSPPSASKVDSFIQFSDKGLDDTSITFGPEANGRPTLNLEGRVDHDGHPLAIAPVDAVAASGVSPPWNWRETPGTGEQSNSFEGRVITVKCGDYTKRIGIDGTAKCIILAIRAAFRLRTKRLFWLEDEDNIVRTLDRDMPLGNYTLHVDEGLTIKVCLYEEADHLPVHTEDKTFYNEDEFYQFLTRRGWSCLREYNGYRNVDKIDELCHGAIYRGISN